MSLKRLFVLIILSIVILAGCSQGNNDPAGNNSSTNNEQNQESQENGTNSESNAEESEDQADQEPVEQEEPGPAPDPVIVDNLDITASVTGPSLKEAYKDYFMFGVGLNGYDTSVDTIQSAAMREVIKHQFNSVTYTNLMKPTYLLDQQKSIANAEAGMTDPGVVFDTSTLGMDFSQENGIKMRGHTLVWHTQTPDWFFKEGFQSTGALVDRDTMLQRLESYIKQVLEFYQTEYPGVIYAWDVVNEAVEVVPGSFETETGMNIRTKHGTGDDNLWYLTVGVDYPEKAFEYARKYADPDVKLFYNDYNTFQPRKTTAIYNLASSLKEKGLIDGIGMQSYMGLTYPGIVAGGDNILAAIQKFAQLELEIQLTELTLSIDTNDEESLQKQADRYKTLFQILVGQDTASGGPANITSVTVFGIMDEYMLYPDDKNYSRLFDGQLQPKPAFHSIMSVVQKD